MNCTVDRVNERCVDSVVNADLLAELVLASQNPRNTGCSTLLQV